jgi:hypothetical protein
MLAKSTIKLKHSSKGTFMKKTMVVTLATLLFAAAAVYATQTTPSAKETKACDTSACPSSCCK